MSPLRPAVADDLDRLLSFTRQEAEEAGEGALDEQKLRRGVGSALQDPSLARYFLIEPTGGVRSSPIGFVSVTREWSDWNGGFYYWIQAVFITPSSRGKGILGQVVDALSDIARDEGALDLRLYAHATNARALRAYRKVGFEGERFRLLTRPLSR